MWSIQSESREANPQSGLQTIQAAYKDSAYFTDVFVVFVPTKSVFHLYNGSGSQSLAEQNICLYIGSVSQSLAETGKSNIASIHSGLGEKKTHKHYVFDDISMIFR